MVERKSSTPCSGALLVPTQSLHCHTSGALPLSSLVGMGLSEIRGKKSVLKPLYV